MPGLNEFLQDPKVKHEIQLDFNPVYIGALALFFVFLVILSKKI